MKKLQLIFGLISIFCVSSAFANTVSLDTTFNGTGVSIRPAVPAPLSSFARSFVIQPDGKIVILGDTYGQSLPEKFALMRLNADGSLDTSFGTGGTVTTLVDASDDASRILLQPDGKILVCGNSYFEGTAYNITLLRYTSSGELDTTFNSTGVVKRNINGASWDYGSDLTLQPDGKIIVVGSSSADLITQRDIVVMRVNADGSYDTSFDGDGVLTIANPNSETADSVILQSDGKILTGGYRNDGGNNKFLLMRLNADGTTDTSFGTGGSTAVGISAGHIGIGSMDLQSDGKIIAAGSGRIARYAPGGALDPTFAGGGMTSLPSFNEINGIRVVAGDKILIASKFGANSGVTRLLSNGYPDTNFNGGARNIFTQGYSCYGLEVKIASDGKIVLGGSCTQNGNSLVQFAVWRLQETRTRRHLDFDGNGSTEISIYRPSSGLWILEGSSVVAQFGMATDRLVPADYTGDGRTDAAVFRPSTGEWFIRRSENGSFYSFPFGAASDLPVPGDYDGDYQADAAVFRPGSGEWFIKLSTGGLIITRFGLAGDKPVASDYDGDFKTDIAIYRPSSGEWWIQKSSDSSIYAFQFGVSTDKPVEGDYTGDGKTDAAFYRPSTGEWFILRSEDSSYYSIPFGLSDDLPAPGNYWGDDRFDLVVYRPSTSEWHVQPTGGTYFRTVFGAPGDQPVPNALVP